MLEFVRNRKKSLGAIFLAGFMGILMMGFGVDTYNSLSHRKGAALTINGEEVPMEAYERKFAQLESAYRQKLGDNYENFKNYLNVGQRTIDALVTDILLRNYTSALGLTASNRLMRERLESLPFFQQSGLTNANYEMFLRGQNMPVQVFEETIKREVAITELENSLRDLSSPSEEERKAAFINDNTKVELNYVSLASPAFLDKVNTSDEAKLNEFYTNQSERYRKPKSIRFSYLTFDPAQFVSKVDVTDDDLKDLYARKERELVEPEERQLRQVVIVKATPANAGAPGDLEKSLKGAEAQKASEEAVRAANDGEKKQAQSIIERLNAGEDFAEIARKVSEDAATAKDGGSLGWVDVGKLDEPTRVNIEGLKKGQTTDVIETDTAFKVVKVEDIKQERQKTFDEVRPQLEDELRKGIAPEYAKAEAEAFERRWEESHGKSLVEFAQEQGMTAVTTPALLDGTKDPEGGPAGITSKALPIAPQEHDVFVLGGAPYLVQVIESKEPFVPPFAEVKDQVIADYKQLEAKKLARKAADDLLAERKGGKPLTELAKAKGLELKTTPASSRSTPASDQLFGIPDAQRLAFTLTEAKPVMDTVITGGDTFYVAELARRTPPDEKEFAEKKKDVDAHEKEQLDNRIASFLVQSLRAAADVNVAPELLERLAHEEGSPTG